MFYLHCYKDQEEIHVVESSSLEIVIDAAKNQNNATSVKLFSSDWPYHHLTATVMKNGHLDWIRTKF